MLNLTFSLSHAMILIPMDETQHNHLKAYGLVYRVLQEKKEARWILNYRGGSFLVLNEDAALLEWALIRDISVQKISQNDLDQIKQTVAIENMKMVELTKAPKIAVYAPPWNAPWDDAVTLVLKYAEIPYTRIWNEEMSNGVLDGDRFDWLHLHHEDFTAQYGKFWAAYQNEPWYIKRQIEYRKLAKKLGFQNVRDMQTAMAKKIDSFVRRGGFLFAMCSATDTLDIALSEQGHDIIPAQIDGTPLDLNAVQHPDFTKTLAFENFTLYTDPYRYEFSDIDVDVMHDGIYYSGFHFNLQEFSAKYDTIPCMLNQNHRNLIKGFLGQTTGFHNRTIKKDVIRLSKIDGKDWVNYIHGDRGKGTFTFLAGHDPEDFAHKVGEPPTNLELFPNSPGYRLILNNILFPAAKTKKRKT